MMSEVPVAGYLHKERHVPRTRSLRIATDALKLIATDGYVRAKPSNLVENLGYTKAPTVATRRSSTRPHAHTKGLVE
jgi:hypothetical protein